jgi:hypothetical protein
MAELRPVTDGMLLVLDREEVSMLTTLARSLVLRLSADGVAASDDPIVDRLAPATSRGDVGADRELRAMLVDDLLDQRRVRLGTFVADLERWSDETGLQHVLDTVAAGRLVETLNDLRLAIGASIGIVTLDREQLEADDPRTTTLHLMDHLGWMQGRLIDFIDP